MKSAAQPVGQCYDVWRVQWSTWILRQGNTLCWTKGIEAAASKCFSKHKQGSSDLRSSSTYTYTACIKEHARKQSCWDKAAEQTLAMFTRRLQLQLVMPDTKYESIHMHVMAAVFGADQASSLDLNQLMIMSVCWNNWMRVVFCECICRDDMWLSGWIEHGQTFFGCTWNCMYAAAWIIEFRDGSEQTTRRRPGGCLWETLCDTQNSHQHCYQNRCFW